MSRRIALGFGNNIDYEIVWDRRTVEAMVRDFCIQIDDLQGGGAIDSERDLLISILDFMRRGVGGERFVASNAIIKNFADKFDCKITLGGTPVRAAIAMRVLGYTAALHLITLNDDVRRLLPADCPYVCSNPRDSLHPHLIAQFERGSRIKANDIDISAGASNRLIYHSNPDNIAMRINDDFGDLLSSAEVMLVSGFNAVQDEAQLLDRLHSVLRLLRRLPENALVYAEDAGNMTPRHHQLILQKLGKRVDIFGMNEDELQGHLGRTLNLLDAPQMLHALQDLRRLNPIPTLVVHCRHWALAYGESAARFQGALQAGADLATTRFLHGDDFTARDYEAIRRAPRSEAAQSFACAIQRIGGGSVACAPVADVSQSGGTTIGLGDAFVGGFLPALLQN